MPTVSPTVLALNNDTVSEITAPIALAALGSSSQNNSTANTSSEPQHEGIVQKLIQRYIKALKRERIVYLIFLGIWAFIALCAIGIILWNYHGAPAMRERRRRRYLAENPGAGLSYPSEDGVNASRNNWRHTMATPWIPPKSDDAHYNEKAGVNGATRTSFLQDAAVADAYVSSSSSNGDHTTTGTPYNASSHYPSRSQVNITDTRSDFGYQSQHLQAQEPPTTADILRDFTPLQSPTTQAARNLQHQQASALQDNSPRRLTVDSFMNYPSKGNASKEDEEDQTGKSKWLGSVSWGAVTGKLRNDARRVTMRDPYAFDDRFVAKDEQLHSQFGKFCTFELS